MTPVVRSMDLNPMSPDTCAAMDTPLLAATGLVRRFGPRTAVTGIDMTLVRGEVVGLLGLNGAGKSTLLQMLAGVMAPDEGRITILGEDLRTRETRRHLGYLPQVPPLHQGMRVSEFLHHCARLHGLSRADAAAAVSRVLDACDLQAVAQRRIGNLSGGFRQRIGIAQALVHQPPLVLLDEPTQGLDPVQIEVVRKLLRSLRAQQGVLLSTHLLHEAAALCDRVLVLHEGRIVHVETLARHAADSAGDHAHVDALEARFLALVRAPGPSGT